MSHIYLILIAVGLSIDSFAVSISCGVRTKNLRFGNITKTALIFGIFQGIMPVIGWLTGNGLKSIITGIDHWIAFSLLLIIGLKMIYPMGKQCEEIKEDVSFKIPTLLILGLATSIDALAVGISFAFLKTPILQPALIIAGVTALFSIIGLIIGNKIGHFFEKHIQILGGIVLIGIGIKILIEHLS
ncbi:MAG: manganese efflux pump MntP family protein [Candidatus Peregrinibacteria bacterium]